MIEELVPNFILVYWCIKGSHDIVARLVSVRKFQKKTLIRKFTDHPEMFDPDKYKLPQKERANDESWLQNRKNIYDMYKGNTTNKKSTTTNNA